MVCIIIMFLFSQLRILHYPPSPTGNIQLSYIEPQLVFCHNDLNPMNIFLDKKMQFIDWEYSGLNMPIYEIASIKKSFNFSSDQFKIFLKAYGQDFNLNDINEFEILVGCIEKIWQKVTDRQKNIY